MTDLKTLTEKLRGLSDLDGAESTAAAHALASPNVAPVDKKAFLVALAKKGETAREVADFAAAYRGLAKDPGVSEFSARALDVCGTGGDGSGSFNISTVAGFIAAAAGVPVFKHGNRSITSKSGSADFLEALGLKLEVPQETHRKAVEEIGFTFFFAPSFHPAFKEIMPVRRELAAEGIVTLFNVLGPLINPGRPAHQLLGVFSDSWVQPLADALGSLGLRAGLVVHGILGEGCGMDELTCAGENCVAGFGDLIDLEQLWGPEVVGLGRCSLEDLKGGTAEENTVILEALMDGRSTVGLADTVCLNAGAALFAAGRVESLVSGIGLARETLTGGDLRRWLARARAFYADVP